MILDDIALKKKQTLLEKPYNFDLNRLYRNINNDNKKSFYSALSKEGLSIIGEIKKASPSRGIIKEDFNPIDIAKQYDLCVDAISVLTEEHFFLGSPDYIKDVHNTTNLPVLRKDFIISPMQIFEAAELGASAVLLIVALLDDKLILKDYISIAKGIGLDALVEVHNEKELNTAIEADADIIGINNRNLVDFSENINTTAELAEKIPNGKIIVSESSIHTAGDIRIVKSAGVHAVLAGESFMRSANISEKAKEFKMAYEC